VRISKFLMKLQFVPHYQFRCDIRLIRTQSSNKHTHINKKKRGADGPNIPRPSAITEQRDLHAS